MATDTETQITNALTYRLHTLARELDKCSPELRRLVRMACAGANGETPCVDTRTAKMARMRLNEAATTRTAEAKAERRAAALAALG